MNRLRKFCSSWLMVLAFAAGFSVAALKSKPAPEFPAGGATLDVSDWSFRKSVVITNSGPQELELDLEVLSNAQRNFADLRLMRQGEQIPYLIEPTSASRFITPIVTTTNDPRNLTVSRWMIHLPQPRLPVTQLHCETTTPLFERDIVLYETLREANSGDAYEHMFAREKWIKTPGAPAKEFTLSLSSSPLTDTMILETDNRDNPPIQLGHFQLVYTATSILFEARPGDELFLYYGNPSVSAPHYDLNLISSQLRSMNKSVATLEREEKLNKAKWRVANASGKGGVIFWGILALVVVALLIVIARLLPKSDSQPPK